MVESYLHKMAKELLYKEIKEKSVFEFKTNDVVTIPLGNHGVYMEFPSMEKSGGGGWYPDECGCGYTNPQSHPKSCQNCLWVNTDMCEHNTDSLKTHCDEWMEAEWIDACMYKPNETQNRFSLKSNPGYCKCGDCQYLNLKDTMIHDIASIHKGNIVFAIEIINKHPPSWREMESKLNYQVYLIRAIDILKRVENTPVYVCCIMGRRCWF